MLSEICDSASHRTIESGGPPGKCICNPGYYDNDVNTCDDCHYSWLLYLFINFNIILVQKQQATLEVVQDYS